MYPIMDKEHKLCKENKKGRQIMSNIRRNIRRHPITLINDSDIFEDKNDEG